MHFSIFTHKKKTFLQLSAFHLLFLLSYKVPDEYFSVLLRYLEGLQGSARNITVEKAEAFMQKYDSPEGDDPALGERCERIRKVLQLLS